MDASAVESTPAGERRITVPCKINLHLAVIALRPDGLHDLETLFYPLTAPSDVLIVREDAAAPGLVLSCSDPALETPDNLVAKAYNAFAAATGFAPGLDARLEKGIPHGAGLGGASADAAAMLAVLNAMAGEAALPPERLAATAAALGADVPFFLLGKPALAEGIGDRLTPVPVDLSGLTIVLACPPVHISTPAAYKALDAHGKIRHKTATEALTSVLTHNTNSVCVTRAPLFNSFEKVVFALEPELRRLKERFYILGASAAAMSGSGSAVFGLFKDHDKALDVSAALTDAGIRVYISRP